MNWYPKQQHRRVVELEGGFEPRPIPPGFVPPPPSNVQRVLIEEPTEGWWRQAGAFGYRFSGTVPAEGEAVALTEQLHLPGPPSLWWIHWFRYDRNVDLGEGQPNFELRGRITYGVGGIQNIVEVDVMQGVQLPIVCNSLKVDLVTYNPLPPGGGDAYRAGEVTVGAMFGKGAGGGALPATWTTGSFVNEDLVAGNPVIELPLPDFARSVAVHCSQSDITHPSITDAFLDFNASGGAVTTIQSVNFATAYHELISEGGISIPAGTNQVVLRAPSALVAQANYSLQFFLAF